jgi:uncharacterized protein YkwD
MVIFMKKFRFFLTVFTLALFHIPHVNANKVNANVSQRDLATVMSQTEKNVFNFINQSRADHSLPLLIWSNTAAQQARNHSIDMANKILPFGHDGLDMRYTVLKELIPNLSSMGENVAYTQGYKKPGKTAVQSWLNSPDHYANIMGDFNLTGIGVAKDSQGRYYFTQIFVKTSSSDQE